MPLSRMGDAWIETLRIAAVAGLTIALLAALPASPQARRSFEEQQTLEDWLNGPVALIASEDEQRLFASLEDEPTRAAFVAWFWARRDPSPRTAQNEYEEQFWSLVELADRQINEGGAAWRSARGRILILLGPPDRQTFNPGTVATNSLPTITWEYNRPSAASLPNDYKVFFVDVEQRGKYVIGDIRHTNQTRFEREAASLGLALREYVPPELSRAMVEAAEQTIRWPDLALPAVLGDTTGRPPESLSENPGDAPTPDLSLIPLPLELTAAPAEGVLHMFLRVGASALSYRRSSPSTYSVHLEIQAGAERIAGSDEAVLAGSLTDSIQLQIPADSLERMGRSDLLLYYRMAVGSGEHWLQVAVLDRSVGRLGRLAARVSADAPAVAGPRIGPVALGWLWLPLHRESGEGQNPVGAALAVPVGELFRPGDLLRVLFPLTGLAPDADGLARPAVEYELVAPEGGSTVFSTSVVPGALPLLLVGSLGLPEGPTGRWEVQIHARDTATGKAASYRASFRVDSGR